MTTSIENPFPPLVRHSVRADWGVGILAGEKDGKHRYLFESGHERTLASGFSTMMLRVEKPSDDERAASSPHVRPLKGPAPARWISASNSELFTPPSRVGSPIPGGWQSCAATAFRCARHATVLR